jgi:putative transposase
LISNASLAFDKSSVVKEYKDEMNTLTQAKDAMAKKLGGVIIERDWAIGKLRSLDLSTKKTMVDIEGVQANHEKTNPSRPPIPSLNRQLELLGVSKCGYYYEPVTPFSSDKDQELLRVIDIIHTKHPYYGTRRLAKLLKIDIYSQERLHSTLGYKTSNEVYHQGANNKAHDAQKVLLGAS